MHLSINATFQPSLLQYSVSTNDRHALYEGYEMMLILAKKKSYIVQAERSKVQRMKRYTKVVGSVESVESAKPRVGSNPIKTAPCSFPHTLPMLHKHELQNTLHTQHMFVYFP